MKRRKQGKSTVIEKVREMLRLQELGYNQSEIANSCNVARSTVQDYLGRAAAAELTHAEASKLNDSELAAKLGKGARQERPPTVAIDFTTVHRELGRPGVTLMLLWQEKWTEAVGYSTFCRLYGHWLRHQKLSMRQPYKAGEKMLVDYAGMTVPITDRITREVRQCQIFVSCLGYSDLTFAEATESQALCYWIGSHERALRFYGGVPEAIVPDNLKSGVQSACWYEPELTRAYQDFAEYYGVAILPTRVKKPRDKAKVEKAVQEVERWILAPLRDRTFFSIAELNEAMSPLLEQLNSRTMRHYNASRRELFEQAEREALKPVPAEPFTFVTWKKAKLNIDYHVQVDNHFYSAPYHLVHRELWVKLTEHIVEIVFENKRIACHKRSKQYGFTTLPEHMPPEHSAIKARSRKSFCSWAESIGPSTLTQVEALFAAKQHEEQARRAIMGLQRLCEKFGSERIERACKHANAYTLCGLRHIRSILITARDKLAVTEAEPQAVVHDNLRGQKYYH